MRFYIDAGVSYITPAPVWRLITLARFAMLNSRAKRDAIARVDYYVRLPKDATPDAATAYTVGRFRFPWGAKHHHSSYFFELYPMIKCMPRGRRFHYIPGDVNTEATVPAFVKTRPIPAEGADSLSVISPLDSIRHFNFITDPKPWSTKRDMIVFRNVVNCKPHRIAYLKATFNHPMCDSGEVDRGGPIFPEMAKAPMTIEQMLDYKFIATLEGNDVATNLKWVMSSNSIAVMPRPRIESWYMEADLQPGVHYIEIADDASDLEERLRYYLDHPAEAEKIIENAHAWTRRFRHGRLLEQWVHYQVVKRYFDLTAGAADGASTPPAKPSSSPQP